MFSYSQFVKKTPQTVNLSLGLLGLASSTKYVAWGHAKTNGGPQKTPREFFSDVTFFVRRWNSCEESKNTAKSTYDKCIIGGGVKRICALKTPPFGRCDKTLGVNNGINYLTSTGLPDFWSINSRVFTKISSLNAPVIPCQVRCWIVPVLTHKLANHLQKGPSSEHKGFFK